MNEAFTPLGIALPIIVTATIVGASLALGAFLWVMYRRSYDGDLWLFGALVSAVVALISGSLLAWFMWGGPDYWQDYRIEGRVVNITNTWDASGGQISDRPVVTLDTVSTPLPVYDRRATSLEGRDVALTCTFGWRWRAEDNVVCYIADMDTTR